MASKGEGEGGGGGCRRNKGKGTKGAMTNLKKISCEYFGLTLILKLIN